MANTTKENSEFGTCEKVIEVCSAMQVIESERAQDRKNVNRLFNGDRPYTAEEEKKFQIQINVNWGIGKRIMINANQQLNNALLHPGIMFNCTIDSGRVDKRDEWGHDFTKNIHVPLQRGRMGRRHHYLIRSRNATVCMHGIGAMLWPSPNKWMPRFIPLEDLLVPTDTLCDFSNLRYFAVNLYLTPGELADLTQGEKVDKRWDQKSARQILDATKDMKSESSNSTWFEQPEAMQEIFQQNKGYYYSDKVPTIKLRAFYYQEVDEPNKWHRHILMREQVGLVDINKFLYDGSDIVFANDIGEILNVQYGDANLIGPLRFHSVRGLGVDLFAPVDTLNRLQCEFVQATLEHLKMYFRISDPADRDRLKSVVLQQYGFIPEGLNIVKREERHQIDAGLVEGAMSMMRQIAQENSSSFLQDVAGGEQKVMTAKEAMIRLNEANQMISGMLQMMYVQEAFYYEELVRRFCDPKSDDSDVIAFRKACIDDGIPPELLVASKWKVQPERVLGGGDKTMAQAQAQWLLENRNIYDPAAQQKILRLATTTMLDDPAKGRMLVPEAPVTATQGTHVADAVFGTMMQGGQIALQQGIDEIGYIEELLKLLGAVIQRISGQDNMGTPDDLIGMATVIMNLQQHMMILAGDDKEKQRVKQYGDALGQMVNLIKGFAQRQQQEMEAQQPPPGTDMTDQAKAKSTMMMAEVKGQVKQQDAALKAKLKMMEFELDQIRMNMQTISQIKREDQAHEQKMRQESMTRAVDTAHEIQKLKMQKKAGQENT